MIARSNKGEDGDGASPGCEEGRGPGVGDPLDLAVHRTLQRDGGAGKAEHIAIPPLPRVNTPVLGATP